MSARHFSAAPGRTPGQTPSPEKVIFRNVAGTELRLAAEADSTTQNTHANLHREEMFYGVKSLCFDWICSVLGRNCFWEEKSDSRFGVRGKILLATRITLIRVASSWVSTGRDDLLFLWFWVNQLLRALLSGTLSFRIDLGGRLRKTNFGKVFFC